MHVLFFFPTCFNSLPLHALLFHDIPLPYRFEWMVMVKRRQDWQLVCRCVFDAFRSYYERLFVYRYIYIHTHKQSDFASHEPPPPPCDTRK